MIAISYLLELLSKTMVRFWKSHVSLGRYLNFCAILYLNFKYKIFVFIRKNGFFGGPHSGPSDLQGRSNSQYNIYLYQVVLVKNLLCTRISVESWLKKIKFTFFGHISFLKQSALRPQRSIRYLNKMTARSCYLPFECQKLAIVLL